MEGTYVYKNLQLYGGLEKEASKVILEAAFSFSKQIVL